MRVNPRTAAPFIVAVPFVALIAAPLVLRRLRCSICSSPLHQGAPLRAWA